MNLTAHWELKVVALVLAVALYIYTSGQVRVEKTVTVALSESSVRGLSGDYQVVSITPRDFKVLLSVPSSRLPDVEGEALTPRLDLRPEHLQAEEGTFLLTSALLRLPNDIRIIATEPSDLREVSVKLDRITEGSLPVESPHLAGLAAGLDATVRLDATMVRVAAGREVLEVLHRDHERIRFQEIDLRAVDPELTGEHEERLELTPIAAPQETPYRVLGKITATITVRPLLGLTKELAVPLQVLASRDLLRSMDVTLTPPRAQLVVRGPENLLRNFKPEGLTAYVRLPDDLSSDSVHELPIDVLAPPWLVVEPARVRVSVSPVVKP
jgi:hypothetical protein